MKAIDRFAERMHALWQQNLPASERWERVRTLASEAIDLWPEVAHDLHAFASALDTLARA